MFIALKTLVKPLTNVYYTFLYVCTVHVTILLSICFTLKNIGVKWKEKKRLKKSFFSLMARPFLPPLNGPAIKRRTFFCCFPYAADRVEWGLYIYYREDVNKKNEPHSPFTDISLNRTYYAQVSMFIAANMYMYNIKNNIFILKHKNILTRQLCLSYHSGSRPVEDFKLLNKLFKPSLALLYLPILPFLSNKHIKKSDLY